MRIWRGRRTGRTWRLGSKNLTGYCLCLRGEPFSGEERLGSLFRLVDTGVLDMEEVWKALLH